MQSQPQSHTSPPRAPPRPCKKGTPPAKFTIAVGTLPIECNLPVCGKDLPPRPTQKELEEDSVSTQLFSNVPDLDLFLEPSPAKTGEGAFTYCHTQDLETQT